VTGRIDGLLVDLRTTLGDPDSSLLADRAPRDLTSEGKATLFLESDSDIGRQAEIVLLSSSQQVLHSYPTTLGT
jgi:hypothetical protein